MAASANGTIISSPPTNPMIVDASGNIWTLRSSSTMGLQVACNGVVDTSTQKVLKLGYFNNEIYQENINNWWYVKAATPTASWSQTFNPEGAITSGVQALSADNFVDSIGINGHFSYIDAYIENSDALANLLLKSGIRYLREAVNISNSAALTQFKKLNSQGNVRLNILTGPNQSTVEQLISWLTEQAGIKLISTVEGINEADGWFSSQPEAKPSWQAATIAWQSSLFTAMKASTSLSSIPVLGTTLINQENIPLIAVSVDYIDATNIHPYPAGRNPETSGWGPNGYGSLAWNIQYMARSISKTKPIYATETGYNNNITGFNGVSDEVAAKYLLRLFLNNFSLGIVRTYSYELFDEGTDHTTTDQDSYGIINNDLSVKPAYSALSNLIFLCADSGINYIPGRLDYTVTGETNNLRSVLLGKRDGSFILALWLGTQIWDPNDYVDQPVIPQNVVVKVEGMTTAETVFPMTGRLWTRNLMSSGSIGLVISDSVLLVRFAP